ncbi:Pseudoazurin [Methylophaga lonarensis MPL]|uniref:Pseudoazurin n=1 Tax=Methylophaga lonarensis MPL TaxID=1286106 RepID=M7P299_9GAMM|nr:plastocyanin/azurin family copper-binding protein [Methylophaga lonarensis]EMR13631.1 Pseudoazurin [Methylophaga lonarensis MPL]
MKFGKTAIAAVFGASTMFSAAVMASENHTVTATLTTFEPTVINIAVGDSVTWTQMNGHDTQSLEGYIPEGAKTWHSQMGANHTQTFDQEGIYFYICTPHWGTAMGGVIIVGEPTNYEAIAANNPRGATRRLMRQLDAHLGN